MEVNLTCMEMLMPEMTTKAAGFGESMLFENILMTFFEETPRTEAKEDEQVFIEPLAEEENREPEADVLTFLFAPVQNEHHENKLTAEQGKFVLERAGPEPVISFEKQIDIAEIEKKEISNKEHEHTEYSKDVRIPEFEEEVQKAIVLKPESRTVPDERKKEPEEPVKAASVQHRSINIQPELHRKSQAVDAVEDQQKAVKAQVLPQIHEAVSRLEIKDGSIMVKLEPEQLGSITIKVKETETERIAVVTTEKEEVRKLVAEALGELKLILAEKLIRMDRIIVELPEQKGNDPGGFLNREGGRGAYRQPVWQQNREYHEMTEEKQRTYLKKYSSGINIFV